MEQTMTHAYLNLWFLPRRDPEMAESWCSRDLMINDFPRATRVTWALAVCKARGLAGACALCIVSAIPVTGVLQSHQLESFHNYIFDSSSRLYLPKKTGINVNQQPFKDGKHPGMQTQVCPAELIFENWWRSVHIYFFKALKHKFLVAQPLVKN